LQAMLDEKARTLEELVTLNIDKLTVSDLINRLHAMNKIKKK